jgi:hypothetical protein
MVDDAKIGRAGSLCDVVALPMSQSHNCVDLVDARE